MLSSRRWHPADALNGIYTGLLIGWGAVLGTIMSVLLYGAIVWSAALLASRRLPLPRAPEALWVGAVFALFFLSQLISGLANYSGPDTLAEIAEKLPFLGFIPLFARLATVPRPQLLGWLENGVVSGAFATLAAALFDIFVLGLARAEGLAHNPGPFAVIAATLFGACLLVSGRENGFRRSVAALGALAAATALLLSGMRSLWPILVIAPVLLLFFGSFGRRLSAALVVPVFGALIGALVAAGATGMIQLRLESAVNDYQAVVDEGNFDNSLGHRLRLWQVGVELAAEKPLLGHGPGNLPQLLKERTQGTDGPTLRFTHMHNFLLDAVVRAGLLGAAALLLMFVAPVWLAARRDRDGPADFGFTFILLLQTAYFLSGLFGIMVGHDVLDAFLIYATAVGCALAFPARTLPTQPLAQRADLEEAAS